MPTAPHSRAIQFAWLVRMRWAAIGVQVALVLIAVRSGFELPLPAVGAVIAIEALSNLACAIAGARGAAPQEWWLAAVMVLDTLVLSALLALSGGPFNPFSLLYLVQIALATVVLREAWSWALAALALGCSAGLFAVHRALPVPETMDHMQFHLRGMWLAFGVTTAFIVYFLVRVGRALSTRDAQLAEARDLAARRERLASLATLAAGAAHELATPLSTIALAAKEQARRLEKSGDVVALEDARLIRDQVERCRQILNQLSSDAGATAGEHAVRIQPLRLVAQAIEELRAAPPIRIESTADADNAVMLAPPRAFAQALRSLIKNAQEASPASREVVVRAAMADGALRIGIVDEGTGMDFAVLAKAGEPFFTTKPPGSGMGLGIFLSRAVIEQAGGSLAISSRPGMGTQVRLVLPCALA